MNPLWWIALALWVMVAERTPWRKVWAAYKSWVERFTSEPYQAPVIDADDIEWVEHDPALPRHTYDFVTWEDEPEAKPVPNKSSAFGTEARRKRPGRKKGKP